MRTLRCLVSGPIGSYGRIRIENQTSKIKIARSFCLQVVAFLAALMGLAIGFAPQAEAQSYAAVHGTVTDTFGAVLPNANVTVLDTATGIKTTAQSDKSG